MNTVLVATKEVPIPKGLIRPVIRGEVGERFWLYCRQNGLMMDRVVTRLAEEWLAEQAIRDAAVVSARKAS